MQKKPRLSLFHSKVPSFFHFEIYDHDVFTHFREIFGFEVYSRKYLRRRFLHGDSRKHLDYDAASPISPGMKASSFWTVRCICWLILPMASVISTQPALDFLPKHPRLLIVLWHFTVLPGEIKSSAFLSNNWHRLLVHFSNRARSLNSVCCFELSFYYLMFVLISRFQDYCRLESAD